MHVPPSITERIIVPDMPNVAYHAHAAVGKSRLDAVARSPAHYYARHLDPRRAAPEDTDAFRMGSAVDCAVFEAMAFTDRYVRAPANAPRRPTALQLNAKKPSPDTVAAIEFWREFEERTAGKVVLSDTEWDQCMRMRDAVHAHPAADLIFSKPGKAQTSWFRPHQGLPGVKIRPDWIWDDHALIADLKTTQDARAVPFGRSIVNFRYYVQAAMYRDDVYEHTGVWPEWVFVAVEKEPPYAVAVYQADAEMLDRGRDEYLRNLSTLVSCHAAGEWPAYPEEITTLSLPRWFVRQEQETVN